MSLLIDYERVILATGYKCIAGVDEAGRGPLAGPVVATCVIADSNAYIEGVNDSKKLSDKRREALYDKIMQQSVAVGVGIVDAQEIDRINIRCATHKAMTLAIEQIKEYCPDIILIDGVDTLPLEYEQRAIISGDAMSYSIAAASIIAKVTRDRIMIKYAHEYPEYGFTKHKGYGTKLHSQVLLELGPTAIHRQTFIVKILERGDWRK